MTDFPSLLYTLSSEIPTLPYTWSFKKIPLSGGKGKIISVEPRMSDHPLWLTKPPISDISKTAEVSLPNHYYWKLSLSTSGHKRLLPLFLGWWFYNFPLLSISRRRPFGPWSDLFVRSNVSEFKSNWCLTCSKYSEIIWDHSKCKKGGRFLGKEVLQKVWTELSGLQRNCSFV